MMKIVEVNVYMEIITIQCPKCKGTLYVDKHTKQCFCMYCRAEVVVKKNTDSGTVTLDSLVRKGFLSLEYSDWSKAMEAFDQATNIDPEHAIIYVGKLLAELKMTKEDEFVNNNEELYDYVNYQKAVRFANDELKQQLEGYNEAIRERFAKIKAEEERKLAEEEERLRLADEEREKQRQLALKKHAENAPKRRKIAIATFIIFAVFIVGSIIFESARERAEERRIIAEQVAETQRIEEERLAEEQRLLDEAEAERQAVWSLIEETIESGYDSWHELSNWASEQGVPWYIHVNGELPDQELMDLMDVYGISGNYIEAIPVIDSIENPEVVKLILNFESVTYRKIPAELSQLSDDSEEELNEWLENDGVERAKEEFNEIRIIAVNNRGVEITEEPEFGKSFLGWRFEIDNLASFEDTFLHIKRVYRIPSPTAILEDVAVQRALVEYALNLEFNEIIEMIDEHIDINGERDSDATYEIRELAARGIELLERVELVVDDFDGQITVYYSGIREISSTVNIVSFIRPGEVGSIPRFASADFYLSMGFYRNDWLFFDRTELRMSDDSIRERNHHPVTTHTDVVDGNTVRESVISNYSLVNAPSVRRQFVERMDVNYDHILRFSNRDTNTNLDFTLSNTEISALTTLAEIFNIIWALRETITE